MKYRLLMQCPSCTAWNDDDNAQCVELCGYWF